MIHEPGTPLRRECTVEREAVPGNESQGAVHRHRGVHHPARGGVLRLVPSPRFLVQRFGVKHDAAIRSHESTVEAEATPCFTSPCVPLQGEDHD